MILVARTVEQLDDNLAAADLHLSDEETQVLDEASDPTVGANPYGPLGRQQRAKGREL